MKLRDFLYAFLDIFSSNYTSFKSSNLRVLAYHDIADEANFEQQINFLGSNFNIIDISKLERYLTFGERLPSNPLLITFDDGDISVFKKGLPVLKKYNVPACIFVITNLINSKNDFWWSTVRHREELAGKNILEIRKTVKRLKSMSNKDRLVELEKYPVAEKIQFTIDNLFELQKNNIYIANHSHTHPMFDNCTKEEIVSEIENSKKIFHDFGVGDYSIIAYPNGNYNDKSEEILIEEQVKMAFLFDHKLNKKNIHPLRISRIRVDSDTPISEFRVKVSGLHSLLFQIN